MWCKTNRGEGLNGINMGRGAVCIPWHAEEVDKRGVRVYEPKGCTLRMWVWRWDRGIAIRNCARGLEREDKLRNLRNPRDIPLELVLFCILILTQHRGAGCEMRSQLCGEIGTRRLKLRKSVLIRSRTTICSTVLYGSYLGSIPSVPVICGQMCADLRIPLGTGGGKMGDGRWGWGGRVMTNNQPHSRRRPSPISQGGAYFGK
ncbi:hypothetical protein GGS24DRAFT_242505 [Hypoxylon argillaceum]|nr:hypothetical protein GGS24DRAFT_242505 [Hypoxylon argillaceum]